MNNCEEDLKAGNTSELLNILLVCEKREKGEWKREKDTHIHTQSKREREKEKAGERAQSMLCAQNYSCHTELIWNGNRINKPQPLETKE